MIHARHAPDAATTTQQAAAIPNFILSPGDSIPNRFTSPGAP